jgi:hypothetical protein
MRDKFREYYRPNADEFDHLWEDGVIAIDANVLLNVYRYSHSTATQLLRTFAALRNQIWLPHQAAQEFQRNRLRVISEQASVFKKAETALEQSVKQFEDALAQLRRSEHLDVGRLTSKYRSDSESTRIEIARLRDEYASKRQDDPFDDTHWIELTEIFKGRVGDPFANERLAELYREAESRYTSRTPPGFKDAAKDAPEKYGDFLIWRQIMDFCKESGRPAIFVTDDAKDDWWREVDGRSLGPRVELIAEFRRECGQWLHMYKPDQFLKFAGERLQTRVEESILTEARTLSERRREQVNSTFADELIDRRESLLSLREALVRESSAANYGAENLRRLEAEAFRYRDEEIELAALEQQLRARLADSEVSESHRASINRDLGALGNARAAARSRLYETQDRLRTASAHHLDDESTRSTLEDIDDELLEINRALRRMKFSEDPELRP